MDPESSEIVDSEQKFNVGDYYVERHGEISPHNFANGSTEIKSTHFG